MARMNLVESIDLLNLDVTFPVGGTGTSAGFEHFDGTGWRVDVALRGMDIATRLDLFFDGGAGFEQQVDIDAIGRPVVAPIGGPIQFLLALVLDRDDTVTGTSGADGVSGYMGDDTISGLGGADEILGGRGSDTISGGAGRDIVNGGPGGDALNGNRGNDTLSGGRGADELAGGRGDDMLTGGAGADVFFFRKGDGQDIIGDFEPGIDLIEIGRGANTLSDLAFDRRGQDTVIVFADVQITVENVSVAELRDDANFVF